MDAKGSAGKIRTFDAGAKSKGADRWTKYIFILLFFEGGGCSYGKGQLSIKFSPLSFAVTFFRSRHAGYIATAGFPAKTDSVGGPP